MGSTPQNPVGRSIIRAELKKHPDIPASTAARKLHALNPGVWNSVETCRTHIRYELGVQGNKNRRHQHGLEHVREKRQAGEDWRKHMPDAWTDAIRWAPAFSIPYPARILTLSDMQAPFHEKANVTLAIEYGIEHGADTVFLNGDIVDHYLLSDHEKDPRIRDFPGEVMVGIRLLETIRKAFPDARIYFKHGNHEDRYERFMRHRCPEVLGIPEFTWESVYHTADFGIEVIQDKRTVKMGSLNAYHGHEFKLSGTVMPARTLFTRAHVNAIAGDVHRSHHYSEPDANGKLISCFTTGCLCYRTPPFARHNKWNDGFAFVTVDSKGAFQVDNKRIIDGAVW